MRYLYVRTGFRRLLIHTGSIYNDVLRYLSLTDFRSVYLYRGFLITYKTTYINDLKK